MPEIKIRPKRKILRIALFAAVFLLAAGLLVRTRPVQQLLPYVLRPDMLLRYISAGAEMRELVQIIAEDRIHAFPAIWDTSKGVLLSKKMFRPVEMDGQKRYTYQPGLRKLSFKTGTKDFQRYFEAPDSPRLRAVLGKLETPFLIESSFNGLGFRETDYEKQTGCSQAVLFAGDSFTEGLWMRQNKIFPNLFAERLNQNNSSFVCVMNSGTNGYGILEESFAARTVFKKVPYQTLILVPYPNDIDPDQFAVLRGDLPDLDLRWREYFGHLEKLAAFCKQHSIRLVLAPVPPKDQFEMLETRKNFQGKLEAFSKIQGIDFFDPFETFQKYALPELYLDWDPHLNDSGHQIFAEFLFKRFADQR